MSLFIIICVVLVIFLLIGILSGTPEKKDNYGNTIYTQNNMTTKTFTQTIIVNETQTADQLGSGLLPVFATPALIALMENTAMQLIELPEGCSSVGTGISMKHLKASPIGAKIVCTAAITEVEGRRYTFEIKAFDESGDLIGEATHERFVVNVEKFLGKLQK